MTVKKHKGEDCPCGADHKAEANEVLATLAMELGRTGASAALDAISAIGMLLPQVASETAISFAAATLIATGTHASLQTRSKEEVGAMLAEQLKFLIRQLDKQGFEFSYSIRVKS